MSDGYAASKIDDLPQIWDGFARLVARGSTSALSARRSWICRPTTRRSPTTSPTRARRSSTSRLSGSGAVVMGDGERVTLDPDHVVAVAPQTSRTLASDGDGLRVLCIGSAPGTGYEPPEWTAQG